MHQLYTNYKLVILPIVVLIAMIILSFLFSKEIELLKKQIDNIYFGNFIPVHKLHLIKEKYTKIINTNKLLKKDEKSIIKEWSQYYKQYKTKDERTVVEKINTQIYFAFKTNKKTQYQESLTNIIYLINHEVKSASIDRKLFLIEYKKMKEYLFYSQILILILVLIIMGLVVYQVIKQNNVLTLLNEQYKVEANTDALTNLYNRKYFDTIFKDMTAISKEHSWNSVFVMIDIDFFKQYNDTYGHDAGDIALKDVARTLDDNFNREYEYAFRLGGEEFGIIIFNTNIHNIKLALDNLQDKIAKLKIEHTASQTSFLTLSMGVVLIDENSYTLSVKQMYNDADKKLYHSKQNGRNKYTI